MDLYLGDGMMSDAAVIYEETRELDAVEKVHLVEMILSDLDRPDESVDRVWADESKKRWDAYRNGELSTLSHQEVMQKYTKS